MYQTPYYYPPYAQTGAAQDQLSAYKQPYQTPMPYQAYQQPMQNPPPAQPQTGGMNWVQGESAAKAWNVPPGGSAVLWDTEAPLIYLKSADQTGMPQMRVLEWREHVPEPQHTTQAGNFATVETVRDLERQIRELSGRLDEIIAAQGNREAQ